METLRIWEKAKDLRETQTVSRSEPNITSSGENVIHINLARIPLTLEDCL
ncbi:hypothetical protein C5167_041984 [Papaver somniferum]|nr:hypothetical protein C5167_041984 [Papaver somniferum]